MLIGIDPGHGGSNTGCQYDRILEKDYVLKLGLALRQALTSVGLDSEISRNTDETVSMERRGARLQHTDFVLVLHVNAAAPEDAPNARSLHTYINAELTKDNPQAAKIALEAATEIELCAPQIVRPSKPAPIACAHGGPEERAWNCLHCHKPPAVLVELFFATHSLSNRWAQTPYGQGSLLAMLAAGALSAWYHHEIQHPIDVSDRKLA